MTSSKIEIVTSVQRRRRWTAQEKYLIVQETYEPGIWSAPQILVQK